ncbi:MAG: hypothetical protein SGILL_003113 [Bacillariaceae sp.]
MGGDSSVDWQKSITSILAGSKSKSSSDDVDAPRQVKKLRKLVLLSLQMDDSDKSAKKQFKKAIQAMEEDGTLRLDADGTITLLKKKSKKKKKDKDDLVDDDDNQKKKKRKLSKEEKKSKKKKKAKTSDDAQDKVDEDGASESGEEDKASNVGESELQDDTSSPDKNKPCKGNPQGVTRLFLGNLPFAVDESSLAAFLPGEVTHIKWITDKETGKFYGSAFIEMNNSTSAAEAVATAGSKLIGRPIKINFAPARDGDIWPPAKKVVSGGSTGGGGQAGGSGIKAMSAKPENCLKLFIGNLSYDIGMFS